MESYSSQPRIVYTYIFTSSFTDFLQTKTLINVFILCESFICQWHSRLARWQCEKVLARYPDAWPECCTTRSCGVR